MKSSLQNSVRDVLDAMEENQERLRAIISKGIKISKLVNFEVECEHMLGIEINPIIDFFVNNYPTTKDKFLLTFDDFILITQKWADFDIKQNDPDNEEEVEYDNLEEEKLEIQARSKDNLVLKFDKHSEKIQEIFEKYAESTSISNADNKIHYVDEENKANTNLTESVPILQAKLKNVGKIFDDMAYITGTVILSYMEYLEGASQKKTSSKSKEEIIHYFWKRIHQQELEHLRKTKKNTSIYKSAAASRSSSFVDDKKNANEESKGSETEGKAIKGEKLKVEQPTRGNKRKVVRKVKQKVIKVDDHGTERESEEEVEIEETESDQADFYKEKSIVFEDEKFNNEKGEMLLSFHQFQPFLEDFIHENYEYVLLDANNEFEEYTQQDKKTENLMPIKESSETDPLKKNLIDTISQYEWILSQNKFSDSTEKETAEKLVESLRKQLKEYEQRKTQSMSKNDTNLGKTKEELRMKGLTEIFHFYARQHIPHGIAFEQLVIIMNQVDLGEFTSFCKDFKVPLSRMDIKRAFNFSSVNHKPLEFEQFYKAVMRVGVEVNNSKIIILIIYNNKIFFSKMRSNNL